MAAPVLTIDEPSTYVAHLPAIYREGERPGQANFVGRFLKNFEKLLTGIDDGVVTVEADPDGAVSVRPVVSIEEIMARIHEFFDPLFTPPVFDRPGDEAAFVAWLSGWVALVQNQTWDLRSQRRLLARIVPLYRQRGTRDGMEEYLRIYLREFAGAAVTVEEQLDGIQVGAATIGQNTVVGGSPPFFFFVQIVLQALSGATAFRNLVMNTRAIVDLEKPAHTYYAFLYRVPAMTVGVHSTVAEDTMIGTQFGVFA